MCEKFQIVGSLLRPKELLVYKNQIEQRDDITYPFYNDFEGYEQTEFASIQNIVQKEIEQNITVVTDGEYSKSLWHLDFVWGLKGFERYIADHGYFFRDFDGNSHYETRKDIGLRISDEISGKNHPFIDVYKKLQASAGEHQTKLCIPSPSHILGELTFSHNFGPEAIYKTKSDLKNALTQAYTEFVEEFAAAGGEILQFDDCLWQLFADDNPNSPFTGEEINQDEVQTLATEFIDINNRVIAVGHRLGLKMWTHNCRGNYDSRNMGGGSYVKIANLFLKQLNYDRFFLEWDDDRAGSIEALAVFKDKPHVEIVLGLLSSKTNTLDDEERILKMLDEASSIIDKDRLFISHQCGFASCDGGNELTEAEQWAKIEQGQKLAQAYWQ
ncbi:cobalamin-independent methionine synthase II family protein [Caryophanon tenue]|uniref:5-methyltetrahydropteroyltriglutamate--homocysteine methyltransferase n=1 Tax=Caryophanon tenue TaxID=33978 RepID=A0A1C0Y5Z9_9BACL|nr:cobalamin-independent methionine synthase II family protein [Caryophanon tenue]OCS82607.1 5-methyltetrahydropteroyltriglutamate--homocysteine methyltransferase [Caryophanon tenue]